MIGLQHIKVISGGQTGVDRGALEAASLMESLGLGGWGGYAPRGFQSEDETIPEPYRSRMREIDGGYKERTLLNVQAAHGTVVIYTKAGQIVNRGGTHMTLKWAWEEGRAVLPLFVERSDLEMAAYCLAAWIRHLHSVHMFEVEDRLAPFEGLIEGEDVVIINFAGPRESKAPGIQNVACEVVGRALEVIHGER